MAKNRPFGGGTRGHIDDNYCKVVDRAIEMATPLLRSISHDGTFKLIGSGSVLAKSLQRVGVDVMIWVSPHHFYCIEVKGASKTYPTIHIEDIEDISSNKKGWIHYIRSDFLLWVYLDTEKAYMLRVEPLKKW